MPRNNVSEMTNHQARDEHLAWCKERALEYIEAGDIENGIASMLSDMGKHRATAKHPGLELMMMQFAAGLFRDMSEVKRFIEGFH